MQVDAALVTLFQQKFEGVVSLVDETKQVFTRKSGWKWNTVTLRFKTRAWEKIVTITSAPNESGLDLVRVRINEFDSIVTLELDTIIALVYYIQ